MPKNVLRLNGGAIVFHACVNRHAISCFNAQRVPSPNYLGISPVFLLKITPERMP